MIGNWKFEIGNYLKINKSILLVILAATLWGGTPPIMKLTLTQIPVFSLAFIRMSTASIILGFLIYKNLKIKRADWLTFFWAAVTGVTLNLTFFFIGLKFTQAILASFLVAAVPILTLLASHIFLKEKFTLKLIFASTVAFAGVAVLIGNPSDSVNLAQTFGNILLLLASLAWVAHEIIAKKLLKVYDGGVVAFYSMAIGAVTFLPMAIVEFLENPAWIKSVNSTGFAGLIYGILFASLTAYWAWQKGLSGMPAGQASFFFYIDPISGAIFSILLLGEKLTPSLFFGGLLITAAVLLAEQKRKNHPLIQS